mmetsp:Transcript_34188/g.78975  ORF Transcript_34188/g.78975 Transcript_34188/m.78975 type:complete len:201 (-) Transcript_34188:22-624(-)
MPSSGRATTSRPRAPSRPRSGRSTPRSTVCSSTRRLSSRSPPTRGRILTTARSTVRAPIRATATATTRTTSPSGRRRSPTTRAASRRRTGPTRRSACRSTRSAATTRCRTSTTTSTGTTAPTVITPSRSSADESGSISTAFIFFFMALLTYSATRTRRCPCGRVGDASKFCLGPGCSGSLVVMVPGRSAGLPRDFPINLL